MQYFSKLFIKNKSVFIDTVSWRYIPLKRLYSATRRAGCVGSNERTIIVIRIDDSFLV